MSRQEIAPPAGCECVATSNDFYGDIPAECVTTGG